MYGLRDRNTYLTNYLIRYVFVTAYIDLFRREFYGYVHIVQWYICYFRKINNCANILIIVVLRLNLRGSRVRAFSVRTHVDMTRFAQYDIIILFYFCVSSDYGSPSYYNNLASPYGSRVYTYPTFINIPDDR